MFTGLIQEIGRLDGRTTASGVHELKIWAPGLSGAGVALGDSIAVNGICLTVMKLATPHFHVEAVAETAAHTTLAEWRNGAALNLERALVFGDRVEGHLVSGHVDGVAQVQSVVREGNSRRVRFLCPPEGRLYIARKGSVALDGVSLTIAEWLPPDAFTVALIPFTLERTMLGSIAVGGRVNLEVDILARYIERLQAGPLPEGGLTWERLRSAGF
jgi:riboflavin synthase